MQKVSKITLNTIATILLVMGLIAMAGAGGDCDGKCMPGNTMSEFLVIAGLGLASFLVGASILITNQNEA